MDFPEAFYSYTQVLFDIIVFAENFRHCHVLECGLRLFQRCTTTGRFDQTRRCDLFQVQLLIQIAMIFVIIIDKTHMIDNIDRIFITSWPLGQRWLYVGPIALYLFGVGVHFHCVVNLARQEKMY